MQFTTNYDLNKPDLTDKFEVEHQNQNMDIIDGEMKSLDNATSFLATNLITNGNFANGTTGWTGNNATLAVADNILTATITVPSSIATGFFGSSYSFLAGHKYYIRSNYYLKYANEVRIGFGSFMNSVKNTVVGWNTISTIVTASINETRPFLFYANTTLNYIVGDTIKYEKLEAIDLTATFGAGNEPTQAQCDLMFAIWKDATFQISTIASLENNKANRAQEKWITPTLVNGWIPFDIPTYNTFQYMKDEMGFVHTRGLIKSGTKGVVCTLPAGYRPLKEIINPCVSNNGFGRVDISADGVVTCVVYDNAYVSLQGISFKAER